MLPSVEIVQRYLHTAVLLSVYLDCIVCIVQCPVYLFTVVVCAIQCCYLYGSVLSVYCNGVDVYSSVFLVQCSVAVGVH